REVEGESRLEGQHGRDEAADPGESDGRQETRYREGWRGRGRAPPAEGEDPDAEARQHQQMMAGQPDIDVLVSCRVEEVVAAGSAGAAEAAACRPAGSDRGRELA